nr:glycosyltransferase [Mariprofundus sp. KV]
MLTIVCATKNAGSTVESFLLSYGEQKTDKTELVIVDSCSKDDTLLILNRHQDQIDQMLVEGDRGIYEAWNKGIRLASGDFVCFIGADDIIADGAIDEILSIIKSMQKVDYIHGYNVSTENGVPKGIVGRPYDSYTIEKYMPMAHVMSAHRKAWLIKSGMFDETYKSSGDYEFLLRVKDSMCVVESKKIFSYVEDNGISRGSTMPIYEAFRAKRSHGVGMARSVTWLARGLIGHYIRCLFER